MGKQFGNYEILRKIASGGMAEVFLAKHRGLGGFERLVCIKRILPHLSEQEDFIQMFQDEARIVANLVHPNVAQIYDIGERDGTYFIAMEYVRGEDVRRVYNKEVARGRAMPAEPAAHILMGAAAGLDFAHRQTSIDGRPLGIVHRDVSPQNVLVTYDGYVKLIDFGVAKAEGKLTETRAGVLKGKYSYMSPEQASGDPIDGRTDIFALGITLYEITTGVRLFKRDTEIETLHAVIECNVTHPSELVPTYDPKLEEIVMRALAHEPDDRFSTAGDMERALESFLVRRGHPTSASGLAAYMQDLFAEKLADELLFGGQPWEESLTPSERVKTRRLTPSLPRKKSPSAVTEGASQPQDDDDTEISASVVERTEIDHGDSLGRPDGPRTAAWGAPTDWDSTAESVSKTKTQAWGEISSVPRPRRQSLSPAPVVETAIRQPQRPRWLAPTIAGALILTAAITAAVIVSSRRSTAHAVQRSGVVAIDSEPRGARVVFSGPGAEELNKRYGGQRTAFTIVEGLPVDASLRLRFVKKGYAIADIPLPPLTPNVAPAPIFVELAAGNEDTTMGSLTVLSKPSGANVWIDGGQKGSTPLDALPVKGGTTHKVVIRLPGFEPYSETVYVDPGARRFVEAQLTPAEGSPGSTPNETPNAHRPGSGKKPPDHGKSGRGYLSVSSPVKLKVTVDNRPVGETPIRKVPVDSGIRRVRLSSAKDGFSLRRKVKIVAGRTEMLDIKLRKGKLALNATPWAWVRIGKQAPAETPLSLQVYEGEYGLLFECPDGQRKRETAKVIAGQTTSVSINCRR